MHGWEERTETKGSGNMDSTPSKERLVEYAAFWDSALLLVTFLKMCNPAKEAGKKVQGNTALKQNRKTDTHASWCEARERQEGRGSKPFLSQRAR